MSPVSGFADTHNHQFARFAFGGRVLWGSAAAADAELGSCRPEHGPHGLFDLPGNLSRILLRTGSITSLLGHRTDGAPDFPAWPRWHDLTHQAVPRSALKRAVDGGLRLLVMPAVNNELLGRLTRGAHYHDMAAADLQLRAAKQFEAMIDAEAGGPGRGWYRIVYTPEQARRTIGEGKLAVMLSIEVDGLFGDVIGPHSTAGELEAQVDRYHAMGVRHVFPIHLKNCAYGGTALATSLHWSRNSGPVSKANPPLSLPVYRMTTVARTADGYDYRGGHCNADGLTPLGETLIRLLMERGMVIEVDHMGARSRADVLRLTGAAGYPVVAGHAELLSLAGRGERSEFLLTDAEVTAIGRQGGVVAPKLRQLSVAAPGGLRGTAATFLTAYRRVRELLPDAPIPFGTDLNGFAGMPRPRPGEVPLDYPFTSPVTGAALDRGRLGSREFDINADGVAHVGMLPDFVSLLLRHGLSEEDARPMLDSALGYVRAWERAVEAR
ncbi:membrane dipeptidase [Actinoplanes sp. GCM10030250]|uniref:membrane dipeptidase n=1 Tax=Actinoplanes sp. GCM10030250 TaxID=3273376 RepID=UPI003623669B